MRTVTAVSLKHFDTVEIFYEDSPLAIYGERGGGGDLLVFEISDDRRLGSWRDRQALDDW